MRSKEELSREQSRNKFELQKQKRIFILTHGHLYFVKCVDDSNLCTILCVEPQLSDDVFMLAWTERKLAIEYLKMIQMNERTEIVRVQLKNLETFIRGWDGDLLIDRNIITGMSLRLDVNSLKARLFKLETFIEDSQLGEDHSIIWAGDEGNE